MTQPSDFQKFLTHKQIKQVKDLEARIKLLEETLIEIRDIARASDGVEFYAMLAERGLNNEQPTKS